MDIYYCDECGTRVTDLDLRAGRGMRKRHDTICSSCVDQGLAGAWLARAGQAPAAKAVGGAASAPASAVAVAEAPDPISLGRDRARTQPDDPFADEAEPVAAPAKPKASGPETDAIPAKPPSRQTPGDDLAAAGGGLGALVGSAQSPAPSGLVDDPEDSSSPVPAPAKAEKNITDAEVPLAKPESPFDFVHPKDNNNPGKSVTEEIDSVGPKDETRVEERTARTASGRQASQKRNSTATSKRSPAKSPSTRRSGPARRPSNKVIIFSLASCAIMLLVFFAVALPGASKGKGGSPEQITEEPYAHLKDATSTAKAACGRALDADDMPTILHAIVTGDEMMRAFNEFEKAARKRGWEDDNFAEALRLISFNEVKSMLVQVRHRRGIIEQRGK